MFAGDKKLIKVNITSNERGFVMVVALVLLLVLTIIGVAAISSTTVENMLAGNIRLKTKVFYEADEGPMLGSEVIETLVSTRGAATFPAYYGVNTAELALELVGDPLNADNLESGNADLEYYGSDSTSTVTIDIDKIYNMVEIGGAGNSHEGYEGAGVSKRIWLYYRINSKSLDNTGAEATVGTIYQRFVWE